MKFDDLISQIYDIKMDEDENHAVAETELKDKFKDPLLVKAITTSLHSRSVLGRVIVESLTKELQLERTFGCE